MTREILFKAKRKDNGEWVEGYYVYCRKRHYILPLLNEAIGYDEREDEWIEIEPDTICLFTGLSDKNGKKIWENDIVRYTFDYPSETATENGLKERISSVFWSEWRGSWSVYADERKGKGMNNDLFKYARNGNTVEVIGNIFDDKELLEVE